MHRGSAAECAVDAEPAAVALDDVLDDRQAKAGPAERPAAAGVDAVEAFGDACDMFRRDAFALIGDRNMDHRSFGMRSKRDRSPRLAVTQGVGQQIVEQLKDLATVSGN